MKIALMTWFHYDNYGTVLQASALRSVLQGFGHEVDIVNYFPGERVMTLPENSTRARLLRRVKTAGKRQMAARDPVITTRISGEAFDRYRQEHFSMTPYCATLSDLERIADGYDAFVCGSDRIWLPMNFDPRFFLDFVKDPERMIAYAPSILDTGETDQRIREQMRALIGRFRHLSVREESGRRFLDEAFGEKTQELADPTMLVEIEDWGSQMQLPGGAEEHYLLACFQGENRAYWDAAAKLADRLGLPVRIIPIHESDLSREGVISEAVGPVDFISLIRNADYVCTDSYHGTMMALLFGKEFCSFERYTQRDQLGMNDRIHHILNAVGLKDRLYSVDAPLERYLGKIDYIPVNYKIDGLKIRSREYLRNALGVVENYVREHGPVKRHILQGYTLCSGCGACAAVCAQGAIRIEAQENGFLRAVVDEEKCARCENCRAVCPFQNEARGDLVAEGKLLSYQDEEDEMRADASAGALAARLALRAHQRGMAVAGCVFDEQAQTARHLLIFPEDDPALLNRMKGSKYMQSEFAPIIAQLREYEGPAVIFGTPCQIAGAKRVFTNRENLLYVEILCSGVPSRLLFEKYKKSFRGRNRMNSETFALAVRYRQTPAKGRFVRVSDGETEKIIPKKKDIFSRVMESGTVFGEICYECRWRDRSEADLRIGDFRQGLSGSAEIGESICICMTPTGQEMLNDLMISGYWEGLHKRDLVSYLTEYPDINPPRPVFYEELSEKLKDEKVSLSKIANEYIRFTRPQ